MDEAALIQDAKRGDVDAYNGLVLHYQTQAYNVAYRIVGDQESAADAAQEAFIRAYKNLHKFRGGNFKAWLLRIVTNLCYDELRRRKRRPATSLEALYVEDVSPDDAFQSQTENPEGYAQRMEMRRAIEECLRELSDEYRTVVVLSDVQEFSYGEIAEVAQVALGTVKSRLSRARAQMRDCLLDTGELLPASYRLDN
jgi:RNA polymerase sigma-70 factor (ECF subfamily)